MKTYAICALEYANYTAFSCLFPLYLCDITKIITQNYEKEFIACCNCTRFCCDKLL